MSKESNDLRETKNQGLLEFAHLDLDRLSRRGVGEVIFGEGKSAEELTLIMHSLIKAQGKALATRVSVEHLQEVKRVWSAMIDQHMAETSGDLMTAPPTLDHLHYHQKARCLWWASHPPKAVGRGRILVLTAGTSDGAVAAEATAVLKFLGHQTHQINDVGVAGLHRLLGHLDQLRSAEVIIVCAGMEGALSSVVAGLVDCPVIAVPTSVGYGANLGGVTALLGMVNSCAAGVVVVNIDNGFGAAYSAAQINRQKSHMEER